MKSTNQNQLIVLKEKIEVLENLNSLIKQEYAKLLEDKDTNIIQLEAALKTKNYQIQ